MASAPLSPPIPSFPGAGCTELGRCWVGRRGPAASPSYPGSRRPSREWPGSRSLPGASSARGRRADPPGSPAPPIRGGPPGVSARQLPRIREGPECKHLGCGPGWRPGLTPDSGRECAKWPPAWAGCFAELIMLPGLGLRVLTRAFDRAPCPIFQSVLCILAPSGWKSGRARSCVRAHRGVRLPGERLSLVLESLLAGRADLSGRNSKNKEYSDSGALPKCVWSPHKSD